MKKSIIFTIIAAAILLLSTTFVSAAEITLLAPLEEEITPMRDFYVVGTINREGATAQSEPLNIRIELFNAKDEVIRSLESNVSINGLTSGEYFLTDYEHGNSYNDSKKTNINRFTPPDIVFNGVDRDSIRLSYDKVVVKDNYFAAVIHGGISKEFDLKYEDKYETALFDITQGEYRLVVTALDSDGEEVCRYQQFLTFDSTLDRVIASQNLKTFAHKNSMALPNSIVGFWNPSEYALGATSFYYTIPQRLNHNMFAEYANSNKVHIMLNGLSLSDIKTNFAFGSAFSKDAECERSYLYYDIGEENISFTFAGSTLDKKGEVIQSDHNRFIKVNRVEVKSDSDTYVDFSVDNGVILTEDSSNVFYGVYSPVVSSATLTSNAYKIGNSVTMIKAVIVNEDGNTVFENSSHAGRTDEDAITYDYEFSMDITLNEEMLTSSKLTLVFYALDKDGNELFQSEKINVKALYSGRFVTDYDDSYWGKAFCDGINVFGESPSGISLDPNEHITRGNFAAMVNRLMGYAIEGTSKFSDLDENSLYYDDCVSAYQAGYMTGDEKGAISAGDLITREQAMIILARISNAEKGAKEIVFKDSDQISFWAKDYVDAMCSVAIVSGFDGYINPQNNITVAEAAALIIKTVRWMYSDEEILPVGEGNNFVASDSSKDLSSVNVIKSEKITSLTEENITQFFGKNINVFIAVKDYIEKNFSDGAYVGKVGNGLDLRDYKWGSTLTFSQDAVRVITDMSTCFSSFSIKYNPNASENVYFSFGQNADGKEVGIAYSDSDEVNGKILNKLTDGWYYFVGK